VQLELDRFQLEGRLHRESLPLFGEALREGGRLSKERHLPAHRHGPLEQVEAQLVVTFVQA